MLALGYVALMIAFGDVVSNRLFRYVSRPQRLATAFLVGLVLSTWLNYLAALALGAVEQPLLPADALSAVVLAIAVVFGRRAALGRWLHHSPEPGPGGRDTPTASPSERWDWLLLVLLGWFVAWEMTSTFAFNGGALQVGIHEWGDLGPNTAIAQSFALGHNFPTQYPLFAGEPIRVHFLFYFQVGNLTFLGLDPAMASNVLSIGSLIALLALVMALGQRLFRSAAAGRLGAVLFFLQGSLSFIPFLASFPSPGAAIAGIFGLDRYLSSGFPYRGEDWAIWTQNVFLNQRHLASAIGILLVVMLFIVDRLAGEPETAIASPPGAPLDSARPRDGVGSFLNGGWRHAVELTGRLRAVGRSDALAGYVLCGVLLGLLPLWNSPIYVASAVVLAAAFVLLPNRLDMLAMAIPAALLSIPQLLFLRPESAAVAGFPVIHWGYVVEDPTIANVGNYISFLFGPKIVLITIALAIGTRLQRLMFIAVSMLFVLTFTVQLSVDIVGSHKFLNTWMIIANIYAAYGLMGLWRLRPTRWVPTRLVAASIVGIIVIGGVIDLFPIKNDAPLTWRMDGDPLFAWVKSKTRPDDVFLSGLDIIDPILLAGRRLYYGWPVYAWSAGYDTGLRDKQYQELFQERDPQRLIRLLQDAGIAYVVIDDSVRGNESIKRLNEDVYQEYFASVYEDPGSGGLVIYRVPPASETRPAPGYGWIAEPRLVRMPGATG